MIACEVHAIWVHWVYADILLCQEKETAYMWRWCSSSVVSLGCFSGGQRGRLYLLNELGHSEGVVL